MSLKAGDKAWCFNTKGLEWYGEYSTNWICLIQIVIKPYMIGEYADQNMYFETKDDAINAMMQRLEKLRSE
jgi:hypothetical protein